MSSSFDGRGVLSIRPSFSAIRKLEEIFRVGEGRYADI